MQKTIDAKDTVELGLALMDGQRVNLSWTSRLSLLVQAASGGGKSWLLRRIIEQLSSKVQIIVVDAEGEFPTLREKFDFVLIGKDGDAPCDPRTAKALIHMLLEKGVSAVLDISELSLATNARQNYVKLIAEAMVEAPKELWHPVVFVCDEFHLFCTERGKGEAISTAALIDVCARGRKRGIIPIFATQRMAKASKDAIAELQNYLIGGTFLDSDVKRAIEHLGIEGANRTAFAKQIRLLESGEFWGLGRAISRTPVLFRVGDIQTSHPKMGEFVAPTRVPVSIQKLLPSFAALVEQAADDGLSPDEMRAEIERLKEIVSRLTAESAMDDGAPVVQQLTNEQMWETLAPEIQATFEVEARKMVKPLWDWAKATHNTITSIELPPKLVLPKVTIDSQVQFRHEAATANTKRIAEAVMKPRSQGISTQIVSQAKDQVKAREAGLRSGMVSILNVVAAWYPRGLTEAQVALQVGMKNGGSTFRQYRSTLVSMGYMVRDNGYLKATSEGLDVLGGSATGPKSQSEVIEMWMNVLRKGQRELLTLLVQSRSIKLSTLATQAGMVPGGSTFRQYMSTLKTTGLVNVFDGVATLNKIELP